MILLFIVRSMASAAIHAAESTGKVDGLGATGIDAEGHAAAEIAHQRLDDVLSQVMNKREALVLSRSMGLGR